MWSSQKECLITHRLPLCFVISRMTYENDVISDHQ